MDFENINGKVDKHCNFNIAKFNERSQINERNQQDVRTKRVAYCWVDNFR